MAADFEQIVLDAKYLLRRQRPHVVSWHKAALSRCLAMELPVFTTFEHASSAELSILELYRAGGRAASSGYLEVRYSSETNGVEQPESVNRNHLSWSRGMIEVEGTFTGDTTIPVCELDRHTAEILGGLFEMPVRRALQHVNGLLPLQLATV